MNITLNGERREFEMGLTLANLIKNLGYEGKRIAVERNGEIVPAVLTPTPS